MLTTRDGIADRVEALDVGADDYLVKPSPSTSCLHGCGPCFAERHRREASRSSGGPASSESSGCLQPICIVPVGWPHGRYGPTVRKPMEKVTRYGNRAWGSSGVITKDRRDPAGVLGAGRDYGALGRIRTCGLSLRRRTLYPLSYEGPAPLYVREVEMRPAGRAGRHRPADAKDRCPNAAQTRARMMSTPRPTHMAGADCLREGGEHLAPQSHARPSGDCAGQCPPASRDRRV